MKSEEAEEMAYFMMVRQRDEWQRHAIHLYWFYRMVQQGGPDGSDLDEAVSQDAEAASLYVAAALEQGE